MKKIIYLAGFTFAVIAIFGCRSGTKPSPEPTPEPIPPPQPATWSFVQIGDLHAGSYLRPRSWSNTVSTLISNRTTWNLKAVISPGDLYPSDTNTSVYWPDTQFIGSIVGMTNDLWRLKKSGISVFPVPGNHDSDADFFFGATNLLHWNDVFGTNFEAGDPYYFTSRLDGDTRDCAWKMTNGMMKVLFIGLRWLDNTNNPSGLVFENTQQVWTAYADGAAWASNLAKQYPDHYVIAAMHYFMDTNGIPSTKDLTSDPDTPPSASYINEGPGIVAWDALKSSSNLMMVLSGHVRQRPIVRSPLVADDGHPVEAVKFNTQVMLIGDLAQGTNLNGGTFVLYTVNPADSTVHARVYNSDYGRFMTNGEFANRFFTNDWTFPLINLP